MENPHHSAKTTLKNYWSRNLRLMCILLIFWALVSLGCGILWADSLNRFSLPGTGYPLGFWFAQQGSIIVFVFLILIYALSMNRIDRSHLAELKKTQIPTDDRSPHHGEGI